MVSLAWQCQGQQPPRAAAGIADQGSRKPESGENRDERAKDLGPSQIVAGRLDSAAKAYDLEAKDFGRALDTLQNIMEKPCGV